MEIWFSVYQFSFESPEEKWKAKFIRKQGKTMGFIFNLFSFYSIWIFFCFVMVGRSFVICHTQNFEEKNWKNLADFVVFVVVVVWFVVVSITEGANHFARVCLITELALVRLSVTKVNFIFHSFKEKKHNIENHTNQQKECRTNRCSYERNARTLSTTHRHEHAH